MSVNESEEHVEHLKIVFKRLREAGLKVPPRKCVSQTDSIDFLGRRISSNKLEPQLDKLAAVRDLREPAGDGSHHQLTQQRRSGASCVLRLLLVQRSGA